MSDTKHERRSGHRLGMRVPVSVKTTSDSSAIYAVTRDLSTRGIFLYIESEISEGSELEMVLILPAEITQTAKQWVCCRASEVRVEGSGESGSFGVAASILSMEILPEIPS